MDVIWRKTMTIKSKKRWLALGGIALGVLGAGIALKSFLPARLATDEQVERRKEPWEGRVFPEVKVDFLRCGSANVPACFAVRGSFSLAPREMAHSAVLIRHPRGTFLFDSGFCADIQLFLLDQPLLFRKTLANFTQEQNIVAHLQQLGVQPSDLDFVLLSHLHWDHVSGLPDLPNVPVRVRRLEYEAAQQDGRLDKLQGLVRRLMGRNSLEHFDLTGPAYGGFSASFDLFGDGSIVLVPLPGHTQGQVGMFIHRSNGAHLFLIADAAWIAENYLIPAQIHPLLWSKITSEDAAARRTLVDLHHFGHRHPEIPMVAMHDAHTQRSVMLAEQAWRQQQQKQRAR
jgi:N-acyl homoserine lactone hydrolase